MLAKAELHVHLEGATNPSLIKKLAKLHKIALPDSLFASDTCFNWDSFADPHKANFIKAYDLASTVIRRSEDYKMITYEYLAQSAREGVIYTELTVSPDHAASNGLSYAGMLEGVVQGIDAARAEFGIEARIIMVYVRHLGVEQAIKVAKEVTHQLHPYIVGVGLAGDETNFPPAQFLPAFEIAQAAGLGCTAHAGEMVGPEGIRAAITHLPITRIGHGVRVIEDPKLMELIIERGITLECCPTSNIALCVYPHYEEHPLLKLYQAGIKVTLNSDDPPYFGTTIGHEYAVAEQYLGFDKAMLNHITRTAIENSFADLATKKRLLARAC